MRARSLSVLALSLLALAPAAQADPPPPGSTWTQATITEPDGTRLHADVLRPSDLAPDAKTPVIVSVGPTSTTRGRPGPPARWRTRPTTRPGPRARRRASSTSSTART
jgi:uncharacterized protein